MRGGFFHNSILVEGTVRQFEAMGGTARREYPVRMGRNCGFVDAFIDLDGIRIVCEAERTPARIQNDIRKGIELGADVLLIAVPTGDVARAVRRRLRTSRPKVFAGTPMIFVLTFGALARLLVDKSHFLSVVNVARTTIHQSPSSL